MGVLNEKRCKNSIQYTFHHSISGRSDIIDNI